MGKDFKPLDNERKIGIVLIVLMLTAFTIACHATASWVIILNTVVGVLSMTTVLYLMAKSVDNAGGWDKLFSSSGTEEESPPQEPRDYSRYTNGPRGYREMKPLDKERGWGIVVIALTIAAFVTAANTAGFVQTVMMISGMLGFIFTFMLMSKSIDKQNAEDRARKGPPPSK